MLPGYEDDAGSRPTAAGWAGLVAMVVVLALLWLDRMPRFYQGDSTSYLAMGQNGWVPPGQSWLYGYASRWLVVTTHQLGALPVAQGLLLLFGVVIGCHMFRGVPGGRIGCMVFGVVAALDPLNEAYARLWLGDTPAAVAFVAFVSLVWAAVRAPARRLYLVLPALAAVVLLSVFVRIAYAPIEIGTLLLLTAAACIMRRADRLPGMRRRLLAMALLPVLALGALGFANSRVAMPALRGQFSVDGMASLSTMGVFLPGLERTDFERAGVAITQSEFDAMQLQRYGDRGRQMWEDGPPWLRAVLQTKLGVDSVYDPRLQAVSAAVVRSAALHHPWTLVDVFARSLLLYAERSQWWPSTANELGFDRALPNWAMTDLRNITGAALPANLTALPSPVATALFRTMGFYPLLLTFGAFLASLVLLRRRPLGVQHVIAAALLCGIAAAPLSTYAVRPNTLLASVTLSELLLIMTLCDLALLRRAALQLPKMLSGRGVPLTLGLLVVAAYAGQLGLGRWQTDEFTLLANEQALGWHALAPRLLYSPRPVSEALLFLYGQAVLTAQSALIAPFLLLLWLGLLTAGVAAARAALPPGRGRLTSAVALNACLFAFVLTTSELTEFFYWPMAAAAYFPVAGGCVALLFLLSRPLTNARRWASAAALLVIAGASEMGAALAVSFAGAALLEGLSRPLHRLAALREAWWWALPGTLGLIVLLTVLRTRAGVVELGADTQSLTGHVVGALWASAPAMAQDLFGTGSKLLAGFEILPKVAFALGFAGLWHLADPAGARPGRWHAVLAASLIGGAFFSIATAFYHYGALCCERHATTRVWLADIMLVLAASAVVARWRGLFRVRWLPPVLLTASLLPVLLLWDGVVEGYASLATAHSARLRTWRSGEQTASAAMQFYMPPEGTALPIHGTYQPVRTYTLAAGSADTPEMIAEIGRFFGKSVVSACQPWQTDRSLLMDGRFIPSCPAKDGPPDVIVNPAPK